MSLSATGAGQNCLDQKPYVIFDLDSVGDVYRLFRLKAMAGSVDSNFHFPPFNFNIDFDIMAPDFFFHSHFPSPASFSPSLSPLKFDFVWLASIFLIDFIGTFKGVICDQCRSNFHSFFDKQSNTDHQMIELGIVAQSISLVPRLSIRLFACLGLTSSIKKNLQEPCTLLPIFMALLSWMAGRCGIKRWPIAHRVFGFELLRDGTFFFHCYSTITIGS